MSLIVYGEVDAVTGEGSVHSDAVLYNTPSYLTLTLTSPTSATKRSPDWSYAAISLNAQVGVRSDPPTLKAI